MIGFLTLVFGIVTVTVLNKRFWVNESGAGVWFGIGIIITGVIGIASSKKPIATGLNGCNMAFNIVCSSLSVIVEIFFAIGIQ